MTTDVLKILIVDDDPVSVESVQRILQRTELKLTFHTAESVETAVEAFSKNSFDLAIVDYKLPDGTALTILKRIQVDGIVRTPTVVLTALTEKSLAMSAIEQGAQDFLLKDSLTSDDLERAVRYALQRTKLANELEETKDRVQRERELRLFKESVEGGNSTVPPTMREDSQEFRKFVSDYHETLLRSLEESSFKTERLVPSRLREFAQRLGESAAGPKDIVNIHAAAFEVIAKDETPARAGALSTEGKLLLVQLMGYLCDFYRLKQMRA